MRRLVGLIALAILLPACSSDEDQSGNGTSSSSAPPTGQAVDPGSGGSGDDGSDFTTANQGSAVTLAEPQPGVNWIQAEVGGGHGISEQPEQCSILDAGDTGLIRGRNLELRWEGQEATLVWIYQDGTYDGPVTVDVSGIDVSFSGQDGGAEASGTVICYEP